jgi:uncharacterized protein (UPF0335 family)/acylphosphatase
MKIQMKLVGSRVHDIGYRYFLMTAAQSVGIPKYNAFNIFQGEKQAVIVTADGNEANIAAFIDYAKKNKPPRALVSDIDIAPIEGHIMRLSEFAMIFTATQLNKAIPLLLDIRDSVQAVEQNVKALSQDVRTVGENVKEVGQDVKTLSQDVRTVGENVKEVGQDVKTLSQDVRTVGENVKEVGLDVKAVREELKGIRKDTGSLKEGQIEIIAELHDNNIGCNERFAGMESDIQSIKNKVSAS